MQAQPHQKLQVLPSRFRFSQHIPLHLYCSFSHSCQVQGLPVSRYSIPLARIRCNFCQSPTVSCFCHIIIPASDRQHFSGNSRNCDRVFLWTIISRRCHHHDSLIPRLVHSVKQLLCSFFLRLPSSRLKYLKFSPDISPGFVKASPFPLTHGW